MIAHEAAARLDYLNRAWGHRALIGRVVERRYGAGSRVDWYGFGLNIVTAHGTGGCGATLRRACAAADRRLREATS